MPTPPMSSINGGRLDSDAVTFMFERLLASPGGPAHPPAEPDERIHDERCAGQADKRQARVDPEQPARQENRDECLPREIADGFRDRLLDLADVVDQP